MHPFWGVHDSGLVCLYTMAMNEHAIDLTAFNKSTITHSDPDSEYPA